MSRYARRREPAVRRKQRIELSETNVPARLFVLGFALLVAVVAFGAAISWQLILNLPFLITGYLVKYLFFLKQGFGKDYISGALEGIRTCSKCQKVPGLAGRLKQTVRIQADMIFGTALYVGEWTRRRLGKAGH